MVDIIDLICSEEIAEEMRACESDAEMDAIIDKWIDGLK